MQSMNAALAEHVKHGRISKENAMRRTVAPEELERLLLAGAA
jgi:Tfp pilus assembly pilus retraction ATPase PilT